MSATISKPSSYMMVVIIIAMAVAPAFALGDGNRNLLLIGVMALSPIILFKYHNFHKFEIWLVLFMLSIALIPAVHHPESMRWSTVMYSWMFGLTFMAYAHLLRQKKFRVENYLTLLKYLIYAYTIVLIIQQVCVLTGLPVFNLSNYDPHEPFKLNSLAAEPSHSARIVALLMYCYIVVKEIITHRKYNFRLDLSDDKWVWFGFLWTMLTMGSGTAFLFIGIVLLKFLRIKNVVGLAIIAAGIIYGVNAMGINSFDRTLKVAEATLTLDVETIMHADHSASMRIVPMIVIMDRLDITTLDGLLGHGIDFTGTFLSDMIPGLPSGAVGGGFLQIWMEYGFISFILFFIFTLLNSMRKNDYLSMIFWFFLVFMYGVNSQIVWLTLILLSTNKYFYNHKKEY